MMGIGIAHAVDLATLDTGFRTLCLHQLAEETAHLIGLFDICQRQNTAGTGIYRNLRKPFSCVKTGTGNQVLVQGGKAETDFDPDLTISTHFFGSSLIDYYNRKGVTNTKLITVVTDYEAHSLWLKGHKREQAIIVADKDEVNYLVKMLKNKMQK